MFGKKEGIALIISILIISFVFGFDDGSASFNLGFWLINFLKVLLIVTISILLRELVMKIVSSKKGCTSEYEIWNIYRYWFYDENKLKKGIPLGVIISFLLSLFSNGKIYFTIIGKNVFGLKKERKKGEVFKCLSQYDEALVITFGILTTALLAVFFNFIDKISWTDFGLFVKINIWLTIWALVPIPSVNAGKLFINSRTLYIFIFGFVVVMFLLMNINIILNLIISLIIASILVIIFYYLIEY